MASRYDTAGPEAEFEPRSRGRVLRNMQGITLAREVARRESNALLPATKRLIDETGQDQRFTADGEFGVATGGGVWVAIGNMSIFDIS